MKALSFSLWVPILTFGTVSLAQVAPIPSSEKTPAPIDISEVLKKEIPLMTEVRAVNQSDAESDIRNLEENPNFYLYSFRDPADGSEKKVPLYRTSMKDEVVPWDAFKPEHYKRHPVIKHLWFETPMPDPEELMNDPLANRQDSLINPDPTPWEFILEVVQFKVLLRKFGGAIDTSSKNQGLRDSDDLDPDPSRTLTPNPYYNCLSYTMIQQKILDPGQLASSDPKYSQFFERSHGLFKIQGYPNPKIQMKNDYQVLLDSYFEKIAEVNADDVSPSDPTRLITNKKITCSICKDGDVLALRYNLKGGQYAYSHAGIIQKDEDGTIRLISKMGHAPLVQLPLLAFLEFRQYPVDHLVIYRKK